MISRQEAVLSFVKFNKFFKQLNYDIGVTGKVHLSQYADELMEFEEDYYEEDFYGEDFYDEDFEFELE